MISLHSTPVLPVSHPSAFDLPCHNDAACATRQVSLVREEGSECIVVTLLGVDDAVKELYDEQASAKATFCGVEWMSVFAATGLTADDVWSSDAARRDLWHARLFPVLNLCGAEGQ